MAGRLEPSDVEEVACLGDVEEVMKLLDMSSTDLSESQENRLVRLNARNRYDKTALHLAVDRDHLWAVQTLISAGAGINVRGTSYSMSPLMYAVYLDRVSCVCELIKLGADMKCVDKEGRSALMLAALRGRDKCLQYLIKAGADVNFQTKEFHSSEVYAGQTALMYAAEYKWLQCLRLLVRAGADVNLKTRDGLTALHLAARFSIESDTVSKCMSILLEYEADCNAETSGGETALLSMLSNYKTMFNLSNDLRSRPTYECAKMLIHFGSDVNKGNVNGETVLMQAVRDDNLVNFLPILVETGVVIDQQDSSGMTALVHAIDSRSYRCILWLLDTGADVTKVDGLGQTVLMYAARHDDLENLLPKLVEAGVVVDQQDFCGMTALAHAARAGNHKCLRWLLDAEASVNICDQSGKTSLAHAAIIGSYECVQYLVDSGAHLNVCDYLGKTPLEHAISAGNVKCVRWLLDSGADITKGDSEGQTKLMQAARHECMFDLLPEFLLVNPGVLDQQDSSGMTALAHAASTGCHGSLRWLLHAGASVKICDNSGRSPLTHAAENGSYKCVRLLLSSRASLQICDHSGKTPLHYLMSSQKGNWDIQQCLRILISKHPSMDINSVDNQGRTALFLCLQAFLGAERRLTQDQKPIAHSLSGNYTKIKLLLQNDPTENIKLLLQNDAKLGTAILRVGELSRLTEIGLDMDLFQLGLGDEVDLKVQWDKFASVIEKERRRILQFLIINKVVPSLPAVRLRYRYNNTFDGALSMLEKALQFGHTGIAKYLIATCYLRSNDLTVSSARFLYHSVASNNPEVVTMVENLRTQPWPLVKLCFVAVSTAFGASPGRLERVKNSQLPTKLKNMLLFQEPSSRLCVHKWDNIPLTFSLEEYEKLPQPRPLLYHWPVGRKLVPCDCEKCDGTMYKYDKSGRKRKMTEDNMCAIND